MVICSLYKKAKLRIVLFLAFVNRPRLLLRYSRLWNRHLQSVNFLVPKLRID